MSENWIKKWFKDGFQQASTEGPKDDVWKNLDSQLEDWTALWYTSNAETVEGRPSLRVWHNLSRFVESAINERKYARILRLRNASILTIFFMIPFIFVDPINSSSNDIASKGAPNTNVNTVTITGSTTNEAPVYIASNTSVSPNNIVEVTPVATEIIPTPPVTPSLRTHEETPTSMPSRLPLNSIQSAQPLALNIIPQRAIKPMRFSKWSLGASVSSQHTSLLNPTTFRGMKNNSNITNQLSSFIVFNGSVARKLNNRSSMELTASINDRKSQKYLDFVGSKYIEKSLILNYQTLGLSYNYNLFPNLLRGRMAFEASGGIYGSIRTNISEQWAGEDRMYMTEGFKSYDLGLRTELNSVLAINERVHLETGLYYTNGMINIFDGVTGIPSHFYRTFTSAFGANIGLRYAL